MSARYFIDTNILIYSFDQKSTAKRDIALALTAEFKSWIISWQVVQEFCSVALHRFQKPLDQDFLNDYMDCFLLPHCEIMPDHTIYQKALKIQQQTQYRFYDALIVAAALESGASILYSEDLQHNRMIGDLRILNPFFSL